jgi:hypothetical protein
VEEQVQGKCSGHDFSGSSFVWEDMKNVNCIMATLDHRTLLQIYRLLSIFLL